jgi:hypothetical protein
MRASVTLVVVGAASWLIGAMAGGFIAFATLGTFCVAIGMLTMPDPTFTVPAVAPQPDLEEEAARLRIPVGAS